MGRRSKRDMQSGEAGGESEAGKLDAGQLSAGKSGEEQEEQPRPVRNIPRHTRVKVQANWNAILDGLIDRAKKGECSQVKLLMEYSGLCREVESVRPLVPKDDPLRVMVKDFKKQVAKRDEAMRAAAAGLFEENKRGKTAGGQWSKRARKRGRDDRARVLRGESSGQECK